MRRLAVLAASARELAPVRATLKGIHSGRRGAYPHEVGQAGGVEVHLIVTGIGPSPAFTAAHATLSEIVVDAVLSTGYAGALGPAGLGELIVGTEVLNWTTDRPRTRFLSDPALVTAAREAMGPARTAWSQGAMATVENVIWRASEKQALGKVSGAIAVDMESAAIAQAAATAGVPFLAIRAVSDRADEDMPMDLNLWLTPRGRFRGIAQLVRHPSILRSLLHMKRQVAQGSQALARFFPAFLVLLDGGRLPSEALALATVGRR